MIGINITKFASTTKHYYCRFYHIYNIDGLEGLRLGILGIEYAESFERSIPDFKSDNEKELMKIAKQKINDFYDSDKTIWFVCYEGKYSDSRTIFINNLKT